MTAKKIYEWTYGEVSLVRAIDGDTVVLRLEREYVQEIDFGFYIYDRSTFLKTTEVIFRLNGLNTPEVVGEQKARGLLAKAALEELLRSGQIRVRSLKPDKYGGRFLADVWVQQPDKPEISVTEYMIESGHAKSYDGTGVKPV